LVAIGKRYTLLAARWEWSKKVRNERPGCLARGSIHPRNRTLVARPLAAVLVYEPEVELRESVGFNIWELAGNTRLRP